MRVRGHNIPLTLQPAGTDQCILCHDNKTYLPSISTEQPLTFETWMTRRPLRQWAYQWICLGSPGISMGQWKETFPHSNVCYSMCSYNTYSHLTSLPRDGQVYFTTGLTNTHAVFSDACRFLSASVFPCTRDSRYLLFFGRYRRLLFMLSKAPYVLQTQGECTSWARQVCKSFISSLGHSILLQRKKKDTLSNRKLYKHKKF